MAVLLVATERPELMEPTEMRKAAARLELMEEATARLEQMACLYPGGTNGPNCIVHRRG